MGKRSRATLKNYFRRGALPSEEQFYDLIDSMLNMRDEGFSRSPENGVEIAPLDRAESLLSFLEQAGERPRWLVSFDRERKGLRITSVPPEDAEWSGDDGTSERKGLVLSATPDGVGINVERPSCELDVGGIIRSGGRVGAWGATDEGESSVPADGEYHDITGPLTGCHAFEVVAGVGGRPTEGHYALLHAWALNAFDPRGFFFNLFGRKNRIRQQHAFYRSRADRLNLRWGRVPGDSAEAKAPRSRRYCLQLRSNRDYGDAEYRIRYHLTALWLDPMMEGARTRGSAEE